MSPIIIDHLISLENIKFNFARPQALFETSSSNSGLPVINKHTVAILIEIVVVAIIFIAVISGYFIYRRQLKRKQKFSQAIEESEAKIASESNRAAMDSRIGSSQSSTDSTTAEEKLTDKI
ncbi:hypothetical protein PCANC_06885 [Puccinia coronata f. sp. avenae]|uniref:Uncharacterized protein n=1 Tax=Puccinia coronata f. sp. avenae TaxID=200324 RepID=A0A2N5VN78_9BASI|nr:hypothetical protein PCANC_23340 [Puccinia coronata f. sp. avenae]PLW17754.1 hypothetical protein PCANC_09061 [Puccinia coronata f. sp. avenae]PLW24777.1 hypothetical protein PCASD_05188 [Puccinia coronata f. sp. avenae]PLW49209.1 hypothetical protein PCANC_06885 [Puccinia coronata f. sp. avenae]PLW51459.1 hypothetical protein PCASD_00322 [Puccinia coronata f. sp. avenae]